MFPPSVEVKTWYREVPCFTRSTISLRSKKCNVKIFPCQQERRILDQVYTPWTFYERRTGILDHCSASISVVASIDAGAPGIVRQIFMECVFSKRRPPYTGGVRDAVTLQSIFPGSFFRWHLSVNLLHIYSHNVFQVYNPLILNERSSNGVLHYRKWIDFMPCDRLTYDPYHVWLR